jgi:hypothetical protein
MMPEPVAAAVGRSLVPVIVIVNGVKTTVLYSL